MSTASLPHARRTAAPLLSRRAWQAMVWRQSIGFVVVGFARTQVGADLLARQAAQR